HRVNRFRLGRRLQHDGGDVMSMQSPLGRVRGLGSAKNGTHHWWIQRVTAVALIPLVIWFAIAVIGLTGASYETAIAWMQSPFNAIMMVLLIIATFHHMQLGLQVVIEDYVHSEGVKVVLMMGQKLITFALAITAGFAVLKIAFGG
ncbi:MAG: succinate dehydrogenase, hydrophobic membrane anchor protein, partial [Pseudomonadota bacterium]|nr:succinate dehydrogenase, hydrophobic membrane anchor protein [Pseudomonadota bacterium]